MQCEDQQLRSPPRESVSVSARPCDEINARYDAFERGLLVLQLAVLWAILLFR